MTWHAQARQVIVNSGEAGIRADSSNDNQHNDLGNSPQSRAAAGAAIQAKIDPIDPDLAELVARWPTLPEAVRRRLLEIVREAAGDAE